MQNNFTLFLESLHPMIWYNAPKLLSQITIHFTRKLHKVLAFCQWVRKHNKMRVGSYTWVIIVEYASNSEKGSNAPDGQIQATTETG